MLLCVLGIIIRFLKQLDAEVAGHTPSGIAAFRAVAEHALAAAGLHVSQGSQLWQEYRAYEEEVLALNPTDDKQLDKVRALYVRQLQVPLMGCTSVMEEYAAWEQQHSKVGVGPCWLMSSPLCSECSCSAGTPWCYQDLVATPHASSSSTDAVSHLQTLSSRTEMHVN